VFGAGESLRLATEEEMRSQSDVFEVGAFAPLADLVRANEVIDKRLLEPERILFSGGDHDHGVLIDPNDLIQIVQPKVADVCAD
jgi:prolyl-tRNA editing enzyme YbaK/EbsC (Cys-tRNA(Pro) deacylase)